MKRIFYLPLLLIFVFASCVSKEEKAHSEMLVKSIIKSMQNKDTAYFHSLFVTEPEFIRMGLEGQKNKEPEDRVLVKADLQMVWRTMSPKIDDCYAELRQDAEANGIEWTKAQLEEIDKVVRKKVVGVEVWKIVAIIRSGDKTYELKTCESHLLNGKLKFIQVRKYK